METNIIWALNNLKERDIKPNFSELSRQYGLHRHPTLTVSREKYRYKSWFYRKKSTFFYFTIPIYKYMWYNIYEVTKNDSSSIHKQRK